MPSISNATVVAQPYDVGGNGGRKMVMLENGWLVSAVHDIAGYRIVFYLSTNGGGSWSQLAFINQSNFLQSTSFSLSSKGSFIYLICTMADGYVYSFNFNATTQTNVNIFGNRNAIEYQTSLGGTSLAINEQGTELHASWASKNATYPNSFNIRYAKGTINAEGSVTWGAVEQVTIYNSSSYPDFAVNPSITLDKSGTPLIVVEQRGAGLLGSSSATNAQGIIVVKRNNTLNTGSSHVGGAWSWTGIHQLATYAQSSPSAIFVSQRINGLPNGRIWVAWQSIDSNSSRNGLRVAYSDDDGVTWTVEQVRTASASLNEIKPPSITYDENNNVFVVYAMGSAGLMYDTLNTSGQWRQYEYSQTLAPSGAVSAMSMPKASVTKAPVVYTNANKVGFYGSWQETKINVPEGFIGEKDDPSDIFKYAITTDGSMGLITEKVNGVVTRTRSTTSGTPLTFSLTQEQWRDVVHGKYATADGEKNTLSVSMGGKEWSYTFEKRLHPNDSLLDVVRAVEDVRNVTMVTTVGENLLPIKDAIESKKGVVEQVGNLPTTQEIVNGIGQFITGKKWASGQFTGLANGSNIRTVDDLDFEPSTVIIVTSFIGGADFNMIVGSRDSAFLTGSRGAYHNSVSALVTGGSITFNGNSFTMTASFFGGRTTARWIAFE